jgi:hypothetical protein
LDMSSPSYNLSGEYSSVAACGMSVLHTR